MGRKVNLDLWAAWRERIAQQVSSGGTVAEYCRREEIPPATYYQWKRRLQSNADGRESPALARSASLSRARAANGHGQVPVSTGRFVQVPLSPPQMAEPVECLFVDGTVVRIPAGNLLVLDRVLDTIHTRSVNRASGDRHHA
jgi:Transposase